MEVVQGDKYSRQNQHQPQHQNQLSHNVVDKSPYFEKPCFGRGLFKVSLETSPLQRIQAPPCHIRSIAVSSSDNHDGCASVYLGTDSGDIYFFTWHRLVSPADCSAANSIPDSPKKENNHTDLKLVLSKSLGLSPVDFLCLLPRIGAIAVLLDKQVVILDCVSLDILECLLTSKGAFTLARAVGSSELSNGRIVRGSIDTAGESRGLPQTPRRTGGHGHLGRLFGSGRLSARRGVPAISVGESANMQSVQSILQSKEHTLSITEESLSHEEVIGYDSGVESFAVAVKQKLLLFTVKKRSRVLRSSNIANEAISISLKEMVGPEEVVTMAWIENAIITGNYQEYMLFSLVDGQASLIFSLPEGLVSPPLLKVFPKEPEVLLLMDNVGVAVNAAGHPTSSSLVFREIPDAVGQSAAYAVIVRRGVVELYHRKTGAKVQSISLSDTNWGPNIIAEDEDGKFLILASAFKVSFLERVPLDDQLKELLRHKQFDEAVALAEECSSEMDTDIAREKLANVHAQAGFLQFFDLHFKEAVDHFLQSSVMNPAEFFPFFPGATDQWRALSFKTRFVIHIVVCMIELWHYNHLSLIRIVCIFVESIGDFAGSHLIHEEYNETRNRESKFGEHTPRT
ncbi:hypothetical protein KP509_1Z286500 [Ceratopteris richardii]|nr:hypothetical protein KP509_1Z286500 [Ceratopteris richardii]